MGNEFSAPGQGGNSNGNAGDKKEKKKKWEPPVPPPRVGKKQKRRNTGTVGGKLPAVTPNAKCKLRLLKLERLKDYLLMEEEFVANQARCTGCCSPKQLHSRGVLGCWWHTDQCRRERCDLHNGAPVTTNAKSHLIAFLPAAPRRAGARQARRGAQPGGPQQGRRAAWQPSSCGHPRGDHRREPRHRVHCRRARVLRRGAAACGQDAARARVHRVAAPQDAGGGGHLVRRRGPHGQCDEGRSGADGELRGRWWPGKPDPGAPASVCDACYVHPERLAHCSAHCNLAKARMLAQCALLARQCWHQHCHR
jgi:hypothetical protein